jgi:hypothetical protein
MTGNKLGILGSGLVDFTQPEEHLSMAFINLGYFDLTNEN